MIDGAVRRRPSAVETEVAGRRYRTSPGVFWQAHVGAPAALLEAVLDGVATRPGSHVVDLYAGAGLFSIRLAERVGPGGRVLAIEHDRDACADARHNGQDATAQGAAAPIALSRWCAEGSSQPGSGRSVPIGPGLPLSQKPLCARGMPGRTVQ